MNVREGRAVITRFFAVLPWKLIFHMRYLQTNVPLRFFGIKHSNFATSFLFHVRSAYNMFVYKKMNSLNTFLFSFLIFVSYLRIYFKLKSKEKKTQSNTEKWMWVIRAYSRVRKRIVLNEIFITIFFFWKLFRPINTKKS